MNAENAKKVARFARLLLPPILYVVVVVVIVVVVIVVVVVVVAHPYRSRPLTTYSQL